MRLSLRPAVLGVLFGTLVASVGCAPELNQGNPPPAHVHAGDYPLEGGFWVAHTEQGGQDPLCEGTVDLVVSDLGEITGEGSCSWLPEVGLDAGASAQLVFGGSVTEDGVAAGNIDHGFNSAGLLPAAVAFEGARYETAGGQAWFLEWALEVELDGEDVTLIGAAFDVWPWD